MESRQPYRSIFWPILLIAGGVVWLLINLDIIPGWSWWNLWRLWPLLLVAIGVDLLFARRSPLLGAVLGVVTIGLAVVLLAAGPALGLPAVPSVDVVTEIYAEPLGGATAAEIDLDFSVGRSTVQVLRDSRNLIEAEVTHVGEVVFVASGDTHKAIRLYQADRPFNLNLGPFESDRLRWDVGLSPEIPLDLVVDCGVGDADIDLRGLDLTGVDLNLEVGDATLVLPALEAAYAVDIDGGVGKVTVEIEEGADVSLDVRGDVGDITIDVPDDAEVYVEAETDVGDVRVPSWFEVIRYDDDQVVGESGTWQTAGYNSASRRITIVFDGGVGRLTIR